MMDRQDVSYFSFQLSLQKQWLLGFQITTLQFTKLVSLKRIQTRFQWNNKSFQNISCKLALSKLRFIMG